MHHTELTFIHRHQRSTQRVYLPYTRYEPTL